MKTVEINGRAIGFRGLLRKEVKALKREGYDLVNFKLEKADDTMEKTVEVACSPEDIEYLDEQLNSETVKVFNEIVKETFGVRGEEKN